MSLLSWYPVYRFPARRYPLTHVLTVFKITKRALGAKNLMYASFYQLETLDCVDILSGYYPIVRMYSGRGSRDERLLAALAATASAPAPLE